MKKMVMVLLVTISSVLSGCVSSDLLEDRMSGAVVGLVGAQADQLVAELGQPRFIVHSTIPGGPPTYSYLYDKGGCVDTYTVEIATKRVMEYACM
ncbi:hypothetical protein ACFL0R_04915 [Pseudomonadota bacterium]